MAEEYDYGFSDKIGGYMGLDFYMVNSIELINEDEISVELSEELQEFIYKNRNNVDYDLSCIYTVLEGGVYV